MPPHRQCFNVSCNCKKAFFDNSVFSLCAEFIFDLKIADPNLCSAVVHARPQPATLTRIITWWQGSSGSQVSKSLVFATANQGLALAGSLLAAALKSFGHQ